LHTPNSSDHNSPAGENFPDELPTVYNEATMNRQMLLMDEDEFLYLTSVLIEPQFNPVTQFLGNFEDE
jgi:hypothetical protein